MSHFGAALALCAGLAAWGCRPGSPIPPPNMDAGSLGGDAGSVDAGSRQLLRLRVAERPYALEDHPFPSRHWMHDGRVRLPIESDPTGFEWVTGALINELADGFALRPRARVCFQGNLPEPLPSADSFVVVGAQGAVYPVGQVTAEEASACVAFAPLDVLPAGSTCYLGVRPGEGAWAVAPPPEGVMDDAERAVAQANGLVFAGAFQVQSVGGWFAARRAALLDGSAYADVEPELTQVARVEVANLVPGLFGATSAGRPGYVMDLHRHSFVLSGRGMRTVRLPPDTGSTARAFNTVGVTFSVRDGDGTRWPAAMAEDGSISGAVSGAAGDLIDVHQDLFFGLGPFPSDSPAAEPQTSAVIFGRFAAPRWRAANGVLSDSPVRVDQLPFNLWLPSEPAPPSGAPLIIFGHGYTGMANDGGVYAEAFAASGAITVAIDADGHGGGKSARIRRSLDGSDAFSVAGRGEDQNADGTIGLAEGWIASWAEPLFAGMSGGSDGNRQTVLDIVALLDQLLVADLDGVRIDPSRVYYVGHSNGGRYGMSLVANEPRIARAALLAAPGHGYIPHANSFRQGTRALLDVWQPLLTNNPHSVYGLFDEGIPFPGEDPVGLPLGGERIARLLARQVWNAGDSNGEGAAHAWSVARAAGATRADLLIQIYPGDVAVPQRDTMRLVDALSPPPTVGVVQPWTARWGMTFAGYELLYRHLLPQFDGSAAFVPAAKGALAREQIRRFLLDEGADLDVDGIEQEVQVDPDLEPLRMTLGFDFADLRDLLGY
jgi:dienelactone hydrolase